MLSPDRGGRSGVTRDSVAEISLAAPVPLSAR
jgi:hypothetical protein